MHPPPPARCAAFRRSKSADAAGGRAMAQAVRDAPPAGTAGQPAAGDGAVWPRHSIIDIARQLPGSARDTMTEAMFFVNLYGSPVLQAMVGLGAEQAASGPRRSAAEFDAETPAAKLCTLDEALRDDRRAATGGGRIRALTLYPPREQHCRRARLRSSRAVRSRRPAAERPHLRRS